MHKRKLTQAVFYILALCFVCDLPLVAQKLHDEARDKLAQQIKSDFEQLTSPDGNIFEQAIKNADAINDADIQQWRDRERTLIDSVATVLPFMTWKELQDLAFTARNQILDVSQDVDGKTNVSLGGIKAELTKVQNEEKGIQEELKPFDEADTNPVPTVKQIEDALKKTLEDGSPLNLKLNDLQAKISALPDDFSNLKKIVDGLQAPQGLNKLILQTKLLMLQNEEARLQLRQTHFKERQTKLSDFASHVQKYAGVPDAAKRPIKSCADLTADPARKVSDELGSFWQVLGEICKPSYLPDQTVVTCLRNLAQNGQGRASSEPNQFCLVNDKQKSKAVTAPDEACKDTDRGQAHGTNGRCVDPEQQLVSILTKLNQVLDFLSVRYDLFVEQTNLSEDELIFHIRMMQLNAGEHEVLLHSGITGLATYEAGGIKPQDVANIISMAQALAQAAIAARVK